MSVVGVDACTRGWVAIELSADGAPLAHFAEHISGIAALAPAATVIGIDIPIGLPLTGRRRAELEARAYVGRRSSSVFPVPPRAVLEAGSYAEASQISQSLTGGGISKQSYALARKILEVDAWRASAPCRVVEVHPEVSFTEMLGRPPAASKKTWAGMIERRAALAAHGVVIDSITGPATVQGATDDLLDAAAVAWSAQRVAAGAARSFPHPPEDLGDGESAAIWS